MPSNWASFLNNANKGYDQGFDRYQQYDAARTARNVKATGREAVASRALAEGYQDDPTLGDYEAMPQQQALPTGVAGGAPPQTAVPTGGAPAPQAPAPAPQAPAPRPPVSTTEVGVEGDDDFLPYAPERPAAAQPQGTPVSAATKKNKGGAKGAKAVATEEVMQTIDEAMPLVSREVKKELATEARKVQGSGTPAKLWAAAEKKEREHRMMKGDFEGANNVKKEFQAMRHDKGLAGLKNAARLLATDPEAAARELYTAMSNFPDGMDIDIRVGKDGTLYGYGYDEESGEFRGGMPLNLEKITELYKHFEDPVAFQEAEEAERAAQEQTRYSRNKDAREHELEKDKHELEKELGVYTSYKNQMLGDKYAAQALTERGLNGAAVYEFGSKELQSMFKDNQSHMEGLFSGKYPSGSLQQLLYAGDSPIGHRAMSSISDSITSNTTKASHIGPGQTAAIVEKLAAWELVNQGKGPKEAAGDRLYESVMTQEIQIIGHDPMTGSVRAKVDGQVVTFNATYLPKLMARAKKEYTEQEAAANGSAPAPQAGGGDAPKEQAVDPLSNPNPPAGVMADLRSAGNFISDKVGDANKGSIIQAANQQFAQKGHLDAKVIEMLRGIPPEQLQQYGISPELAAAM